MLCVKCKTGKTSVEDSRLIIYQQKGEFAGTSTIKRKRVCLVCKHIFRTNEIPIEAKIPNLKVIEKKNKTKLNPKTFKNLSDEELEKMYMNGEFDD
jgi:transcriptional regulator NrdR family protein|tara:strand:+ start:258 stop:545 length:288 start_codon:yes stop_codon:yes gene_type:complete